MLFNIFNRFISKSINFHYKFRYNGYRNKYQIAPTFIFNGNEILFYGDGKIICEDNSYIGRYSSVQSGPGYIVQIGKHTSLGPNVRIYTNSAEPDQDFSLKGSETFTNKSGNVLIGNNVWIGANVFITEETSIGDNTVVGANSVVNKDLPPFSICAGVPAKVIKFKSSLNSERIKEYIECYKGVVPEKLKKKYV